MFIDKVNDIKYLVLDDLYDYLEDSTKLVIEGGQWSDITHIKDSLKKSIYCVLAIHSNKVVGIVAVKKKVNFKNIIYSIIGLLSVSVKFRKLGIASNLIKMANDSSIKYNIDLLVATINPKNSASIKTFSNLKYNYWGDWYYSPNFYEKLYYKKLSSKNNDFVIEILNKIIKNK